MIRPHNATFIAKQKIRLRVREEVGPDARILEGFAGEGRLYRGCWFGLRGACIDIDKTKAEDAARERPHWACYAGDTEPLLAAGMLSSPWDVVDLDTFGAPWKYLRAFMTSQRLFAETTHFLLTDGYMWQRGMARADSAIFPGANGERITIDPPAYLEAARVAVLGWVPAGYGVDWRPTQKQQGRNSAVSFHHVVMSRK